MDPRSEFIREGLSGGKRYKRRVKGHSTGNEERPACGGGAQDDWGEGKVCRDRWASVDRTGSRTQPGDKKEAGVRPAERAERGGGRTFVFGSTAAPHKRRMCLVEMEERARGRENEEVWCIGWHSVHDSRLLNSPSVRRNGERMSGKAVDATVRSSPVQCTRQSPPTYSRTAIDIIAHQISPPPR